MSNAGKFLKKYTPLGLLSGLFEPDAPAPAPAAPEPKPEVKAPKVETPKVAPTPDDTTIKRKKQREMQRKYAGTGRAGTMLTDDGKLG